MGLWSSFQCCLDGSGTSDGDNVRGCADGFNPVIADLQREHGRLTNLQLTNGAVGDGLSVFT